MIVVVCLVFVWCLLLFVVVCCYLLLFICLVGCLFVFVCLFSPLSLSLSLSLFVVCGVVNCCLVFVGV